MTLTKIPHEGPRVETGPIQFGDDWPGLFIRGDDAFGTATMLQLALDATDGSPVPNTRKVIESVVELLHSCHADNFREG